MNTSIADVPTTNASRYLRQLCRHWSHKFPVEFNDEQGRIELPAAVCTLNADPEKLSVELAMKDGEGQERIEQVVAEHLQRFGFREQLVFNWRRE
jgi:uncharacterized protein